MWMHICANFYEIQFNNHRKWWWWCKKGSFLPFSWFGFGLIISKNAMCLWFCHFTIEIVIFSNHLSLRMHYFCYTNIFTFVCYECYTKHLDMQMSFRSFILCFYSISLFFLLYLWQYPMQTIYLFNDAKVWNASLLRALKD